MSETSYEFRLAQVEELPYPIKDIVMRVQRLGNHEINLLADLLSARVNEKGTEETMCTLLTDFSTDLSMLPTYRRG